MEKDIISYREQVVSNGQSAVYIVDDNADLRSSLSLLLESLRFVPRPFESGKAFLGALPTLAPAPVLLDIRMAGPDGLAVLAELSGIGVKWPVIMMTGHGDIATAVRTMKLGAIEFLEKPFDPAILVDSLARGFAILAEVARMQQEKTAARARLAVLTPRENDVVCSLISGSANKVVAYRLGLSPRTVEMHRANAFAKLGLKSVVDLIALVHAADMVEPRRRSTPPFRSPDVQPGQAAPALTARP